MTTQETLTEIARLVATLPGMDRGGAYSRLDLYVATEDVHRYGKERQAESGGYRWSTCETWIGTARVTASGPHRALVEGTAQEATTNEGSDK